MHSLLCAEKKDQKNPAVAKVNQFFSSLLLVVADFQTLCSKWLSRINSFLKDAITLYITHPL